MRRCKRAKKRKGKKAERQKKIGGAKVDLGGKKEEKVGKGGFGRKE